MVKALGANVFMAVSREDKGGRDWVNLGKGANPMVSKIMKSHYPRWGDSGRRPIWKQWQISSAAKAWTIMVCSDPDKRGEKSKASAVLQLGGGDDLVTTGRIVRERNGGKQAGNNPSHDPMGGLTPDNSVVAPMLYTK